MQETDKIARMKKKRKGPKAFFVFVLVIAIVFVYLLFFYSGLEFQQSINEQGERELVLANNSPLVVESIQVFAQTMTGRMLIQIIPELNPGEKRTIALGAIDSSVALLVVEAPFTKGFSQQIDLRAFQRIDVSTKIIAPSIAFTGDEVNVSLELCNNGTTLKDLRIEEKHDLGFFSEQFSTQLVDILSKECQRTNYKLSPLKEGKTTIFFNIKVLDNTKTLGQEIEIR